MQINVTIAPIKYALRNDEALSQYLYKNEVATTLPHSNAEAIVMAEMAAPENNIPMPATEKNAATAATNNAVAPTTFWNRLVVNFIHHKYNGE